MYLAEFQLYNYKSFLDSAPIKLKPGFNILTGQNNAGKTALMEALSLRVQQKPHRSLTTAPTPNSPSQGPSSALLRISVTPDELKSVMPHNPQQVAILFIPISVTPESVNFALHTKHQEIPIEFAYTAPASSGQNSRLQHPSQVFPKQFPLSAYYSQRLQLAPDGQIRTGPTPGPGMDIDIAINSTLGDRFTSSIYSFRAERMNIGRSQFGSNPALAPDASNLPEALHVLQSTNPVRFRRYNQFVKRVFPQVEWVNVRPQGNTHVEIFVWSVDPETERADLSVPLSESGTGISQVLAMLYVLVTADLPRTILIDEPNSFLHPGAVRVLMEILREHSQHQYIISTHSPELIAASNPSTVHLLRRKQGATQVESVDTEEAQHLRTLLLEVGSRISDVFGAESVLWVEGPTEQLCFPLIVRELLRRPLAGVTIVGVLHTGDFDAKRDTRSVFRIYERLTTQGSALMPPATAFIFDRELRPERNRQDLERQSQGRVHFLSRRTYENYLLHAGAIADVLNKRPPFTEAPTSPERVQAWLDAHAHDSKYYVKANTKNYPQDIDAPNLLDDLFHELSEKLLSYNKVEHSLALTEWLLAHAPEGLKEIADLLARLLPPSAQPPSSPAG